MAGTFDYEKYQKTYQEKNPAKVEKWRNNAAANLLLKRGYSVIDPDGKPCTLKKVLRMPDEAQKRTDPRIPLDRERLQAELQTNSRLITVHWNELRHKMDIDCFSIGRKKAESIGTMTNSLQNF